MKATKNNAITIVDSSTQRKSQNNPGPPAYTYFELPVATSCARQFRKLVKYHNTTPDKLLSEILDEGMHLAFNRRRTFVRNRLAMLSASKVSLDQS